MTTTDTPGTVPVLLVFFSRPGENYCEGGRRDLPIGNTKKLARMLHEAITCDVYEISPAEAYPDAYDPTVERNIREEEADARPRIRGELPDVSGYGTVLLGSPVWNSRAPMIMSTFTDAVDLSGKTVLPFVTYAVSGMSGVDDAYRRALPDADVREGLAVRGETVDEAEGALRRWIAENHLI